MKAKKGNTNKKAYMDARKEAYRKAKLKGRVAEAKFLEGNSRKEAEEKFDKATKYDELLGRSSNPYKKYEKGGSLKAVPSDAKGLKKLPTSVRNKMGYMEEGGKVKKKKDKKKDSFEGYKKVGSSKSLNALSLKKRVTSREHPNAQFKYTKDKKGDTMHIYAKYEKGGKVFKPHKMYKKGCKPEMAKSMKDHLRLKKKGYGHKKV